MTAQLDMALTQEWMLTASNKALGKCLRNPNFFRTNILPRLRKRGIKGKVTSPVIHCYFEGQHITELR